LEIPPKKSGPRRIVVDEFLSGDALAAVRAAVSPERLKAAGLRLDRDDSGATCELPADLSPALTALVSQIDRALGFPDGPPAGTLRLEVAQHGHSLPVSPGHTTLGKRLSVATARVFLTEGEGGAIRFPRVKPPFEVRPKAGRAAFWLGVTPTGAPDPTADTAIGPVRRGPQITLTRQVFATLFELTRASETAPTETLLADFDPQWPRSDAHLVCILDPITPDTTRDYLAAACRARGVTYQERLAADVGPDEPPLPPGTLLVCFGTSLAASQVEAQLFGPGVATLYRHPEGPFLEPVHPFLSYVRAGLPTPRTAWVRSGDRERLRETVDWLGGPPIVVRVPGGEGGVGTLRADSLPALFGLVDLLEQQGMPIRLTSFIPDAMHWRCVVLGDRVLTAYKNPTRKDDFRSEPSSDPTEYGIEPPAEVARLSIKAAQVTGGELCGVDVLVHPSGRCYVLEANFPCYWAQATDAAEIDVAGPLVDHLLAKATALS